MKMKLESLVPEVMARIDKYLIADKFRYYLQEGKENHWYTKDFDRWAAAMLRGALFRDAEVCEWYHIYQCDDTHIDTLFRYCLKQKGFI